MNRIIAILAVFTAFSFSSVAAVADNASIVYQTGKCSTFIDGSFCESLNPSTVEVLSDSDLDATIGGYSIRIISVSSEHTSRRGSKKRTNDKHTKPRSGRKTTKNRSSRSWRSR